MSNNNTRYKNVCEACLHTWLAKDRKPVACPVCNKKNNVIRRRIESAGNYSHPYAGVEI
jgi:rubrerythrin